jgi:hypothetical protein
MVRSVPLFPELHHEPDYEERRFGRPEPLTRSVCINCSPCKGNQMSFFRNSPCWPTVSKSHGPVKPQIDETLVFLRSNHVFYTVTFSSAGKEFRASDYASTEFPDLSHSGMSFRCSTRILPNARQSCSRPTRRMNSLYLGFMISGRIELKTHRPAVWSCIIGCMARSHRHRQDCAKTLGQGYSLR